MEHRGKEEGEGESSEGARSAESTLEIKGVTEVTARSPPHPIFLAP